MLAEPGDDAEAPGPTLDRFDLEIVEFMLSWAPYGGPPEEECMPLSRALLERADAHLAISSVTATTDGTSLTPPSKTGASHRDANTSIATAT
jgi:hypothetical protein